jgi:hypothetical protein
MVAPSMPPPAPNDKTRRVSYLEARRILGGNVPPPAMPKGREAVAVGPGRGDPSRRCILGHAHDSKGEAVACPIVHARAAHLGLTTFRPGRPGMPCFRVAADDNGRPAYVSVDWVLVDAAGRVAVFVDYKGAVAKSKRFDKGWARGKRIVEAEYGVRVVELATPEEANVIEVNEAAATAAKGA